MNFNVILLRYFITLKQISINTEFFSQTNGKIDKRKTFPKNKIEVACDQVSKTRTFPYFLPSIYYIMYQYIRLVTTYSHQLSGFFTNWDFPRLSTNTYSSRHNVVHLQAVQYSPGGDNLRKHKVSDFVIFLITYK